MFLVGWCWRNMTLYKTSEITQCHEWMNTHKHNNIIITPRPRNANLWRPAQSYDKNLIITRHLQLIIIMIEHDNIARSWRRPLESRRVPWTLGRRLRSCFPRTHPSATATHDSLLTLFMYSLANLVSACIQGGPMHWRVLLLVYYDGNVIVSQRMTR